MFIGNMDLSLSLYIYIYIYINIYQSHSFSNCTSVNTSNSCHPLQGNQYRGQEHFVHKRSFAISCLYVCCFVNEGNALILLFFPDEVDALGSS